MSLNIKKQVVNKVGDNDIDELILSHYGLKRGSFDCVASEEWPNDSEHEFDVERKPLDQWGQKKIDA